MKLAPFAFAAASVAIASAQFVDTSASAHAGRTNDPAAVELFRDRGFGLFIHWGVDGSLGGVISHSLVGASPDYVRAFLSRRCPTTSIRIIIGRTIMARLAKLAGFRIRHVHRQAPCWLLHVGHAHYQLQRDAHALRQRCTGRP